VSRTTCTCAHREVGSDSKRNSIYGIRGGDRTPPAWFLNVRDSPAVGVRLQGNPKRQMRGWVATPAVRERLWPRVIAEHHNDAYYQSRTTR